MPADRIPTSPVSKRAGAFDSSGIRKVFDLAAQLEDPINLSIGQPDFAMPQPACAAAKAAIDGGTRLPSSICRWQCSTGGPTAITTLSR